MSQLIKKIIKSIDLEYDYQSKQLEELSKTPLEDRIRKGDTINNVTIRLIDPWHSNGDPDRKTFKQVEVTTNKNISKFSEGSRVLLQKGKYKFELIVIEDHGEKLLLETGFYLMFMDVADLDSSDWQIDQFNPNIRHIIINPLYFLNSDDQRLLNTINIVEGKSLPDHSLADNNHAESIVQNTRLNPSQKRAFINAYSANNYYLVQGPPGSGKTWLLAQLARAFAQAGKKVLITAFTHTAINNALQKCSVLAPDQPVYKISEKYQTDSLNDNGSVAKLIKHISSVDDNPGHSGLIVGTTVYAMHARKLNAADWDIIIFDEAGQMPVYLAVAAMIKGSKYIFIGDHKQLPPIIAENQDDPMFQKSIFEHLFQFHEGEMLNITYRMNEAINAFPNKQFYNGKLEPDPANKNWKLEIDNNFTKHADILDINSPEVLVCHNHDTNEPRSEFEANLLAEFVEQYLSKGLHPASIGIITPLRTQVREIKSALSRLSFSDEIKLQIFVDTVERMQGQEKDLIIYSMVVSDPIKALQRPEFYFNPNRLNVALTRAKRKRIVIANKNLFQINSDQPKLIPLIQNFKDLHLASTVIDII